MTFRNINLFSILGFTEFQNNKMLNIKVIDIKAINENGQNIIDVNSPPQSRTSNIFMSGLNFINGKKENVIGQVTNYDPNQEILIDNIYFHRGDLSEFLHYYDTRFINGAEWIRLASDNNIATTTANSLLRYKMICPITQPTLNGKIMRGIMSKNTDTLYTISVVDAGDGSNSLPARVTPVNQFVSIQVLPEKIKGLINGFQTIFQKTIQF